MEQKITVCIELFEDIPDKEQRYLASIKEGNYKGTIVTAGSVSDCFMELSKSILVLDDYRKKILPR